MATLLHRIDFDATDLHDNHPSRLHHPCKQTLFAAMGGGERRPRGTLSASRWMPSATDGLELGSARVVVESVLGPFDYEEPGAGVMAWHVNFADPELFAFYGGPAFAQDEIQVAEHPSLACLREALKAGKGFAASTHESGPTPVLVRNVERWGAIDTRPTPAAPEGIYGRKLSRASDETIRGAVRRLEGRTSNIIAIAAPQGRGRYRKEELSEILATAITGFAAARIETELAAPKTRLRVCTGHWGTGAFGGNRVVMAALQIAAANFVGVDEFRYYSLDDAAARALEEGRLIADALGSGSSFDAVVQAVESHGFHWGNSDGN